MYSFYGPATKSPVKVDRFTDEADEAMLGKRIRDYAVRGKEVVVVQRRENWYARVVVLVNGKRYYWWKSAGRGGRFRVECAKRHRRKVNEA